jgi:hypothetical protein
VNLNGKTRRNKTPTETYAYINGQHQTDIKECRNMWTEINLAQDRQYWWALVNMGLNLCVPQNSVNSLTSSKYIHFSRITLLHVVTLYIKTMEPVGLVNYIMAYLMICTPVNYDVLHL